MLTEIGRRLGMLFGSAAMLVTILVGLFSHGNIATVAIYGLAAGILFGAGGLLIGSLVQSYIVEAAKKEVERRLLERELAQKMMTDPEQAAQSGRGAHSASERTTSG